MGQPITRAGLRCVLLAASLVLASCGGAGDDAGTDARSAEDVQTILFDPPDAAVDVGAVVEYEDSDSLVLAEVFPAEEGVVDRIELRAEAPGQRQVTEIHVLNRDASWATFLLDGAGNPAEYRDSDGVSITVDAIDGNRLTVTVHELGEEPRRQSFEVIPIEAAPALQSLRANPAGWSDVGPEQVISVVRVDAWDAEVAVVNNTDRELKLDLTWVCTVLAPDPEVTCGTEAVKTWLVEPGENLGQYSSWHKIAVPPPSSEQLYEDGVFRTDADCREYRAKMVFNSKALNSLVAIVGFVVGAPAGPLAGAIGVMTGLGTLGEKFVPDCTIVTSTKQLREGALNERAGAGMRIGVELRVTSPGAEQIRVTMRPAELAAIYPFADQLNGFITEGKDVTIFLDPAADSGQTLPLDEQPPADDPPEVGEQPEADEPLPADEPQEPDEQPATDQQTPADEAPPRDGARSLTNDEVVQHLFDYSNQVYNVLATPQTDLDADGTNDWAAVVATWPGGSGVFYEVWAVSMADDGGIVVGDSLYLGDRIDIIEATAADGIVTVALLDRHPDEPFSAQPTVRRTVTARLVDGSWVSNSDG